jgi:uncharacterized protein YbaP (TraB family)
VQKAFDGAKGAFFEVDLLKDAAAQMAALRLPEGETLAGLVPADLLARLDARLAKISPLLQRAQLGELKPMAWVVLVPTLHEQMKKPGVPVLDAKLYGDALRGGKTVGGLEKPAEQTAFLDTITHSEAVLMLRSMLDQFDAYDASGRDPVEELIDVYLRGDGAGLLAYAKKMMADDDVPEDLEKRLMQGILYDRNRRIAASIARQLKESPSRPTFFAVGAMHLIGDGCVQEHLEKLGVTTRRVKTKAETPEPAGVR